MEDHFKNDTAVVTGAAHGIGRSICRELAVRGAAVYCCDVEVPELDKTVELIQAEGGTAVGREVDVTNTAAVETFVEMVAANEDSLDILVNVAGGVAGQTMQPVEEVSEEEWEEIVEINLYGTFLFSREVVPYMKRQRKGRIINISSGAGRSHSLTGIQAYASAKAGQIGLTRQLAHELGEWDITVNCVAPGFVLSNPSTKKQWEDMGPEGQQALLDRISLHRLGKPEEIAHTVVFFASPYASYITGQTISVDGGKWMLG